MIWKPWLRIDNRTYPSLIFNEWKMVSHLDKQKPFLMRHYKLDLPAPFFSWLCKAYKIVADCCETVKWWCNCQKISWNCTVRFSVWSARYTKAPLKYIALRRKLLSVVKGRTFCPNVPEVLRGRNNPAKSTIFYVDKLH